MFTSIYESRPFKYLLGFDVTFRKKDFELLALSVPHRFTVPHHALLFNVMMTFTMFHVLACVQSPCVVS
jgi:hypothetical protein